MRLPLMTDLSSRDGSLAKDTKIVNGYSGSEGVSKRPGNADLGLIEAGIAQVMVCFEGLFCAIDDVFRSVSIAGSVATPTVVGSFTPVTADLAMTAQSTGAAQPQQLLIKSSDQAWVYTP